MFHVNFEIETAKEPIKTLPDTEELRANPNANPHNKPFVFTPYDRLDDAKNAAPHN